MEKKTYATIVTLLVIDMQKDYTGESKDKSPIYLDTEEKINTINRMIDLAVQQNMKILYVCQVFDEFITWER